MSIIPELLAPAGSYEALLAAIEAGADAVYLGGEFNARAFARNFDREKIKEATELCHSYGVRVYITLNTVVFEKELPAWLEYAHYLWMCGADAFIVADLGAARLLSQYIPEARLHASTQMSVHNSEGVRTLRSLGFERIVVARELSRENIESIVRETGAEIEMFVHGALCVSVSGQCLFSSLVGGRSGNRGECAQPCRMMYNKKPLLSLKDSCLAQHITEILPLGVASLKIEGRMKSPEYVYGNVKAYRELLDTGRNASAEEVKELERLFCRSGFTDGYFISRTDGMCGVRTDSDKKKSEDVAEFCGLVRKIPVSIECEIHKHTPMRMSIYTDKTSATAEGAVPLSAISAPIDAEAVKKSLCKLGATPYECKDIKVSLSDGLYVKVSELNSLRRSAIEALERSGKDAGRTEPSTSISSLLSSDGTDEPPLGASARFISAAQLRDSGVGADTFERIFLPLDQFFGQAAANGIICPPLVYDSEWDSFIADMKRAREAGAEFALCSNISEIKQAHDMGYTVTADIRLNCTNPYTAQTLRMLGADEIILSPELKMGGMRDIHTRKSVIIYGKIPVMLTEKCPIKEDGGCAVCKSKRPYYLTDRTGARFPAFGDRAHRCTVYNSIPVYMADAKKELARLGDFAAHFIFSDETGREIREVLDAYKSGYPSKGKYRRI